MRTDRQKVVVAERSVRRGVRGAATTRPVRTAIPHLTITKGMQSRSKTTTTSRTGMALVAQDQDSRFGQLERRSRLALEDTVHKDPVFPIARHKEVRRVVVHFQMAA